MSKLTIMMLAAALAATEDAHAESCSDVLSHGVFEQTRIHDDSSWQEAYRKFQCSSEMSSSSDARGVGIGLGVPVFGVPLKLDTTFTKQHRESWQKANCSEEERQAKAAHSLSVMYTRVAPDIIGAWKACTLARSNARGARCELAGDATNVVVRYSYLPHNALDAKTDATVKSVSIAGMTCKTAPNQGDAIGPAEAIQLCTREQNKHGATPAVFALNLADKGSCIATLEGAPAVVAACTEYRGETVFSSDTTINARRVCLKEGAVLRMTHGASLTITADEVVAEGKGASIIAVGEQGAKGAIGAPGNGGGVWPARTDRDYHAANGDCSRPGHPDRGRQGGVGGRGGRGGKIVIRAVLKGTLVHDVTGGPGGPGGDPGRSLTHIRPDGRDPWMCPNDGAGPAGPVGAEGLYSYEPQNAGYRE